MEDVLFCNEDDVSMSGWGAVADAALGLGQFGLNIFSAVESKKQADRNYTLEKDAFDYNKELSKTMMDREDNAIKRRMDDLEAAGLHPALAAGSPAQSQPGIAVQAPRDRMDWSQVQQIAMNMQQMRANISMTNAQKKLIEAQARKTDVESETLIPSTVNYNRARAESEDRLRALHGVYLGAQSAREHRLLKHYDQLDEESRERANLIIKQLAQLTYDLQYSEDNNIRTTDHQQYITLINSLEKRLDSILNPVAKGIGDFFSSYDTGEVLPTPRRNIELEERFQKYLDNKYGKGKAPYGLQKHWWED